MGTWDYGLLDNDTAADGLAELEQSIVEDIQRFGEAKTTARSTAQLAAAVGVLLQLSSFDFSPDSDSAPIIVASIRAHEKRVASLDPPARDLLLAVAAGKGEKLAKRPDGLPRDVLKRLYVRAKKSPFGKREPSLFEPPAAKTYVQSLARRCVEAIDSDFDDPDTCTDLCREAPGIAYLAALLILAPSKVSPNKIARWQKRAKAGLATLEAEPNEELPFYRKYYRNLDVVFEILMSRYSPAKNDGLVSP